MSKKKCIAVTLSVLSVLVVAASLGRGALGSSSTESRRQSAVATGPAPTGTLQKMIVENGTVSMDLDLSALNGDSSLVARPITLQFAVGANSFFPILIFNDLLRGLEPGSMALVPAGANAPGYSLPASLSASFRQLVVEKLPSGQGFDLVVRDSNTGFTFFNVEGHSYDYDPAAQSLAITNGRLLVSKEFANALGRESDAGAVVGTISVGATMQPTEIDQLVNGQADIDGHATSPTCDWSRHAGPGAWPGCDCRKRRRRRPVGTRRYAV